MAALALRAAHVAFVVSWLACLVLVACVRCARAFACVCARLCCVGVLACVLALVRSCFSLVALGFRVGLSSLCYAPCRRPFHLLKDDT